MRVPRPQETTCLCLCVCVCVTQAKTLAANEVALKAAEKRAAAQLQQVRSKAVGPGNVQRKPFWFERFNWFITRYVQRATAHYQINLSRILQCRYSKSTAEVWQAANWKPCVCVCVCVRVCVCVCVCAVRTILLSVAGTHNRTN